MSDVLTRVDFHPEIVRPSIRSTRQRSREYSIRLTKESPRRSYGLISPVPPYGAPNAPPESMPHGAPSPLTDNSIRERRDKFGDAVNDAIELSETLVSEDESSPIDDHTLVYAVTALTPLFIIMKIPAPLVLPLQNGGIGAEWHAFGMNIELRFRNPYHTYAVLEDARGIISPFHGLDPYLVQARAALREFAARVG